MWYLCDQCVKHSELKIYIKDTGRLGRKCVICGSKDNQSVPFSNNRLLQNLFRSIVRLNYSQKEIRNDYQLIKYLTEPNNLLTHYKVVTEPNHYQKRKFFGKWSDMPLRAITGIENKDNDIKIFLPTPTEQSPIFNYALKEHSIDWVKLNQAFIKNAYTEFNKIFNSMLFPYIEKLEIILKKDELFFRARLGYDKSRTNPTSFKKFPYEGNEIYSPPAKNATQGKFNKHKVSIFYGATNLDTVISEMRPHPGHHVSIAQFKTKKNLKIIDLTSFKLENFCNSDKELWSYNFLSHLQNFINTPILPEEKKSLYKFTIAIAEYFNQNSYSGLLYKSSISNGNNVALFDKQVTLIPGSAELYKISSVTFKKEKVI